MFRISQLAQQFGLSRSTLLYYDHIGLLSPKGRSGAGYRLYAPADRERLAVICTYRQAGLGMEDIRRLLAAAEVDEASVIRERLDRIGGEILALQKQQRLLAGMLAIQAGGQMPGIVDKAAWTAMLHAAGMDDAAMTQWHREFEQRAPQAHQAFLLSLGIDPEEVGRIREYARCV